MIYIPKDCILWSVNIMYIDLGDSGFNMTILAPPYLNARCKRRLKRSGFSDYNRKKVGPVLVLGRAC